MTPTYPKATGGGGGGDTTPAPQSATDDNDIHCSFIRKNGSIGHTASSTVTPRVIFDFRCPSSSTTSSSGSGNTNGNATTPTKARAKASPKKSNRIHRVKWTPVPPLPSSWKSSTSTTASINGHNHKRVHDIHHDIRHSAYSPKKQRTTSSVKKNSLPSSKKSSMLSQPPQKSLGALFYLLLCTLLLSFVTLPIILSSFIHLGGCSNVEKNLVLSKQTTVHESVCYVTSIAIAHILHHLPEEARSILVSGHQNLGTIIIADGSTTMTTIHENFSRKNIFQRVTTDHTKKHHDRSYDKSSSSSSSASEEIDRMHPIRHILEGASIYTHVRKQKQMVKWEETKKKKKSKHHVLMDEHDNDLLGREEQEDIVVDWKKWKYAMSDDYELSSEEITMVTTLAERVRDLANTIVRCTPTEVEETNDGIYFTDCNNLEEEEESTMRRRRVISSLSEGLDMPYRPFHERVDFVAWGGGGRETKNNDTDTSSWWPKQNVLGEASSTALSSHSEGGRLLAGYLKIMKWPSPDFHVKFPFRLCARGCDSEVAVLHTLEWRTKYKPWCVSEETIHFNRDGFIYARGHSRPGLRQRELLDATATTTTTTEQKLSLSLAGHSMVWFRPSLASPTDNPHQYGRSVIHAVEMAVSDSLERNDGTIGRFNVVVDCANMSSKNSPSMSGVKTVFSVLQDHFPDRLGVLLLANLSGLTQLLLKMVLPFVTEDVRAKIHIIPTDEVERREMLLQFIDEKHIPYYLGGKDGYEFDAEGYYQGKCVLPDESIQEYLTTMPYHA